MKMKRIAGLLLAGILTTTLLAGCGGDKQPNDSGAASGSKPDTSSGSTPKADGEFAKVLDAGTLKIGYTDYEPMNYMGADGTFTGFDTEFAEAVCEKLGVKPEFIEIVWETKSVSLESGEIDAIWNGMTITDELKSNHSLSDPYAQNTQVIITTKANKDTYADLKNLAGKTVALEAGSAAAGVAKDDENLQNANIVEVTKQTDALLEVKAGTSDAAIFDQTMADSMIGEGTDFSDLVVCGIFHKEEYGVAFRKDSNITARFNTVMAELKADGTLSKLAEKYGLTLA